MTPKIDSNDVELSSLHSSSCRHWIKIALHGCCVSVTVVSQSNYGAASGCVRGGWGTDVGEGHLLWWVIPSLEISTLLLTRTYSPAGSFPLAFSTVLYSLSPSHLYSTSHLSPLIAKHLTPSSCFKDEHCDYNSKIARIRKNGQTGNMSDKNNNNYNATALQTSRWWWPPHTSW